MLFEEKEEGKFCFFPSAKCVFPAKIRHLQEIKKIEKTITFPLSIY
jgi:hypothetical protein